jgi:hypothetical protein
MTMSLFACIIHAQIVTGQEALWDYPVKAGTREWKNLDSYKARVDACQIPERLLASIPAEKLTDICLQYPLLCDIFAFDAFRDGINHMYDSFNGFRELFKRTDAPKELLKRYDLKIRELPLLNSMKADIEKGGLILSISKIKLLLSRLGSESRDRTVAVKILQGLVAGYESKLNHADFMSLGFATNYFSRMSILASLDRSTVEQLPQTDRNTVLCFGFTDTRSVEIIDGLSYQWIKQER